MKLVPLEIKWEIRAKLTANTENAHRFIHFKILIY